MNIKWIRRESEQDKKLEELCENLKSIIESNEALRTSLEDARKHILENADSFTDAQLACMRQDDILTQEEIDLNLKNRRMNDKDALR